MKRITNHSPPQQRRLSEGTGAAGGAAERFQRVLGLARRGISREPAVQDPDTADGPIPADEPISGGEPYAADEEALKFTADCDEDSEDERGRDSRDHEADWQESQNSGQDTPELGEREPHGREERNSERPFEASSRPVREGTTVNRSLSRGEELREQDGAEMAGVVSPQTARPGAAQAPAWVNDTANLVYSLCSGVPTAFQAWNLTVPIGAEPLADTQLNLSLSPHTLTLRFQPGSSSSEGLILKHRSQLKALLEEHPAIPSNIDIDTV